MFRLKFHIYRFLMRKRLCAVEAMSAWMRQVKSRADVEKSQVDRFNVIWAGALKSTPFYRAWQEKYSLPGKIKRLDELRNWPILTKSDLRQINLFERTDGRQPTGQIMTGGSTGEPVRLPGWSDSSAGVSQLLGRRAYGIELGDRTFLLWGHEHLYGAGFRRKINALKRRFKDWLADWMRVSAYDLSANAMHDAYSKLAKFQPKFVIGFSPAVLAFVRQNAAHKHEISSVRVILCTAGPLTPSEKQEIIDFFTPATSTTSNCKLQTSNSQTFLPRLCMEYGSVECAIMAYTRPCDGEYDVFWNTHLIQVVKQPEGEYKNIVTRLTDCYVPLIRYDIGDYLDLGENIDDEAAARSVLHFRTVKGRPSEILKFKCGVSFFGALIGDCVKQVSGVLSSQIAVNEGENVLYIRVTANEELTQDCLALIKNRFKLTVANADKLIVQVVQVPKLFTTVGGKTPRVVRI